jgi:hypothetical protein
MTTMGISYMQTESHEDAVWTPVKDTYGRDMGEIVGVVFDLEGGIESIGVRESGGRFIVYSGKRLAKHKSYFVVVPEWRTEAQSLAREMQSLSKRERAIEQLSRSPDTSPKVLEDVMGQIAAARASHERLRVKIEARLKEVESRFQSVSDFVGIIKVQRASSEIDEGSYLVTEEFGRVELEADARELDELRRAIGFLEDIEEKAPLPNTDGLSSLKADLPVVEPYAFQEVGLSMADGGE